MAADRHGAIVGDVRRAGYRLALIVAGWPHAKYGASSAMSRAANPARRTDRPRLRRPGRPHPSFIAPRMLAASRCRAGPAAAAIHPSRRGIHMSETTRTAQQDKVAGLRATTGRMAPA